MTKEEKLSMLQSICGDPDAVPEMLEVYLDLAADVVIRRAYPFLTDYILATVPEQYSTLQVQIANEMYLKRGAEGEQGHSENGIVRSYESGSVSDSLLKQIVPFTRMLGEKIPENEEVSAAAIGFISVGSSEQIINVTTVTCTDGSIVDIDEGYRYVSSDTAILTVSSKGVITGVAAGTATITVTGKKSGLSTTLSVDVI